MSGSDTTKITRQRALAVALAAVMLLSMGGMALVGGAGAQATGGTFDGPIEQQQNVGVDLALDEDADDHVRLVGPDAGDGDVEGVSVDADGSIDIDGGAADSFTGAALTPDRVDSLGDFEADPATEQADFLDESVEEFEVNPEANGDAFPAIFADFDPQSDFSQIEVNENDVDGTHDYIVIAEGGAYDDLLDGTTSESDVVALSVSNEDDGDAEFTELADGDSFGDVIGQLVDESNEQPVVNDYLENVLFGAGTIDAEDTVTEVQLSDEPLAFEDGQTLHSEKITLNPGEDEEFYSSISAAADAGDDAESDTVDVAPGTYDTQEDSDVDVNTDDVEITGAQAGVSGDDDTRLDGTELADLDSETIIGVNIDITEVDDVTFDGVVVEDDSNPAVQVGQDNEDGAVNPTFTNSIVDYSGTDTAVEFGPERPAPEGTFTNNAILADSPEEFEDGEVGLDIGDSIENQDNIEVADNLIVGFETQVDANANLDLQAIVDAHPQFADDDRAQAALVFDENDEIQGANVFGSIAEADGVADDGDTIDVVSGVYFDDAGLDIDTDDVTVQGDDATVEDAVNLNSGTSVTFDGFTVTDGGISDGTDASDVTISNVDLEDAAQSIDIDEADGDVDVESTTIEEADGVAVNIASGDTVDLDDITVEQAAGVAADVTADANTVDVNDLDVDDADAAGDVVSVDAEGAESVSVSNVNATNVGSHNGVDIAQPAGDIVVEDVHLLGEFGGETAVEIADASDGDVTVDNVTADAEGEATDGIDVSGLNNDEANEYTFVNNELENLGDGTGLTVTTEDGGTTGDAGVIDISDNVLTGGEEFTGVFYNLADAEDVTMVGNEIIGDNVAGGEESVGFEFEAITGFGDDPFAGSGDDGIPFQQNTVTNHARLITEGDTDVISEDGYNAIFDAENENTFGTLVIGEDGTYEDAFGEVDDLDVEDANSYLPGSISEAVSLVGDAPEIEDASLEVRETDENADAYVDEEVDFPDADSISVTGESDDILVETNFVIDTDPAEGENNVDISDLVIDADDQTAIEVDSDNTQSEFDNLDVTTSGTGLDVTSDEDDVNVVTVTDSEFEVTADGATGIHFAAAGDDRDGFVIENVELTGPGIDSVSTGLDLSDVDKPGKEGIVELSVTGLDVDGFEEQVVLSDSLTDEGVTAEAVLENSVDVDDDVIVFDDNSFEQAVLVFNNADDELDVEDVLFGSIDAADSAATAADARLDVEAGLYGEDVTLGAAAADSLTVNGPAEDVATAEIRDEEAIILGDVDIGAESDSVTIDGMTVIGQSTEAVLTVAESVDVTVVNTALTNSDGLAPVVDDNNGIDVTAAADVTLEGAFVGNHDEGITSTVDTGVFVNSAEADLTVDSDTTLTDGTGTGIDVQSVAPASVTIEGEVSEFDDNGVTLADETTLTLDGADVSDNGAYGVEVADDAGDAVVTVENDATVSGNDAGVYVESADEVTVTDSTLEDNAGIGVGVLAGADFTVTDAVVQNNGYGVGVDDDDATLEVRDNTIENDEIGIQILAVDATETTITQNTLENSVSISVADGVGSEDLDIENNAFLGDGDDTAIENNDGELDATLNYFGETGPAGPSTPGVDDGDDAVTVYDPFLTDDLTGEADDVSDTAEFGHDVVIPGDGQLTSVGFPAQPAGDADTIEDVLDPDTPGTVFAWDDENEQFVPADTEDDIEAFDAFVVQNTGDDDAAALIKYQNDDDRSSEELVDNSFDFEGLNFVAPQAAGTVDEALFPGGDTDSVSQPFAAGENLYGDTSAAQVRDQFVTADEAGFSDNFRSGAGDRVVHPHSGYFVIVNEDSNQGLTVAERIPTPSEPTEANIADRTDDSAAVTNVQTGETFDNLLTADRNADAGDTLQLSGGDIALDSTGERDSVDIQTQDLTVQGAGEGITTLEGDITVSGNNTLITDLTIVGSLDLAGDNAAAERVTVESNSPGGALTIDAANVGVSDSAAEQITITESGDNARVSNTDADNADIDGGAEVEIDNVALRITEGDNVSNRLDAADEAGLDTVAFASGDFDEVDLSDEPVGTTEIDTIRAASGASPTIDGLNIPDTADDLTVTGLEIVDGDTFAGAVEIGSESEGVVLEDNLLVDGTDERQGTFVANADDAANNVQADNDFDPVEAVEDGGDLVPAASEVDGELFGTIQAGVDAAGEGDTVTVFDGTYEESVTIDTEGLTLQAAEEGAATIENEEPLRVEADNVVVDGFEIVDANPGAENRGIKLDEGTGVTIQNNEFEGFRTQITMDFAGDDPADVTVQNNVFRDTNAGNAEEGTAVGSVEDVDGLDILNNEFVNNRNDIGTADSTENVTIDGNDFTAGDSEFYVTVRADGLDAQDVIDDNSFDPDAVINAEVEEGNELIAVEGGALDPAED